MWNFDTSFPGEDNGTVLSVPLTKIAPSNNVLELNKVLVLEVLMWLKYLLFVYNKQDVYE